VWKRANRKDNKSRSRRGPLSGKKVNKKEEAPAHKLGGLLRSHGLALWDKAALRFNRKGRREQYGSKGVRSEVSQLLEHMSTRIKKKWGWSLTRKKKIVL